MDKSIIKYIVEFEYSGPYSNFPEAEGPADKACAKASDTADAVLTEISENIVGAEFKWGHEYMLPDGSLYKWVESDLENNIIFEMIKDKLQDRSDPEELKVNYVAIKGI